MSKNLVPQIKLADWTVGTTGATAASGAIIDTDGYEGVLFLAKIESTAATDQLVALGGTATNAMSEYTGPNQGEASGVLANLYLDVFRPKKRYVQGQVFASAGGKNLEVLTILYGPREMPITQTTTVWNGRELATPNTGTATASG